MKVYKIAPVLVLVGALSLFGCAEEEAPITGQTEEQPSATEDMAQEETTTQTGEYAQGQGAQPGSEPGQQTGMAATGEPIEVAGTVEESGDGYVLRSLTESYQIETEEDLSQMVGKDVRITGALQESGGQRLIQVEDVTVIE